MSDYADIFREAGLDLDPENLDFLENGEVEEGAESVLDIDQKLIQAELACRSLADFVQIFWRYIEPGRPLVWGWYLDAICDHLEAVTRGDIQNLLINIPPRFLKSTIVSVMWPAWEWLHKPYLRYITTSYDLTLAVRDAVSSRQIMHSPLYQVCKALRDKTWTFQSDQNVKSYYKNSLSGHRYCGSPSAGVTGHGGDRVMTDDPHDVRRAESDAKREEVCKQFWDSTMGTRVNDPKTSAKIIVMQRLHQMDLSGYVLEKTNDRYDVLVVPLMYEPDHPVKVVSSIGWSDPRTEEGELLLPERFGPEEVAKAKERGEYHFIGQYQQRPVPAEGVLFKTKHLKRYTELPIDPFDRIILSFDFTFKGKNDAEEVDKLKEPDYVVGTAWGVAWPDAYLLDQVRGQWDVRRSVDEVVRLVNKWRPSKTLIEDKANGPSVMNLIEDEVPSADFFTPQGSKIQRALSVVGFAETGHVYIPADSVFDWVYDYVAELTQFPFAKYDDRVDSTTQALVHIFLGEDQKAASFLAKFARRE